MWPFKKQAPKPDLYAELARQVQEDFANHLRPRPVGMPPALGAPYAATPPVAVEEPLPPGEIALGTSESMRAQLIALDRVIFDTLTTPSPSPALLAEWEAYVSADLPYQAAMTLWKMKLDAARRLGLAEYTPAAAVELLTGLPAPTPQKGEQPWTNMLATTLREEMGFLEKRNEGRRSFLFRALEASPVYAYGKINLTFGFIQAVRVPIPVGIALRTAHCRKMVRPKSKGIGYTTMDAGFHNLGTSDLLFDSMVALAPEHVFASPLRRDPAVFAMINGPVDPETLVRDHRLFLLGRWE